jgi:hypothetical protein
VAYHATATFNTPIVDAGFDAGDQGTILYNAPTLGAVGHEMGMTSNGYLFWRYSTAGQDGIAYSTSPDTSVGLPLTPQVIVNPGAAISGFKVGSYGVVYKTAFGVYLLSSSSTTPTLMGGVTPACDALALDTSSLPNVYCRTTSGTIVMWSWPSYATPTTIWSGIPSNIGGTDLVVESSIYFSTTTSISYVSVSGGDGGVPSPSTLVSGQAGPHGLFASSSHYWWFDSAGNLFANTTKSSTIAYNTNVPPTSVFQFLAADPSSSDYAWVASPSEIYHAYYFGASSTRQFKSSLLGVGGIAADYSYVFWTLQDGTVRRASKTF